MLATHVIEDDRRTGGGQRETRVGGVADDRVEYDHFGTGRPVVNPHCPHDPARALAKGEFAWTTPGGRDLALYALERAARSDAALARPAWEKQRGRLPEADRRYGNARIAYHAARQLHPLANEWYREAAGAAFNDGQHTWRVRAALRAGAWSDVLAAIAAMPPALSQEPA